MLRRFAVGFIIPAAFVLFFYLAWRIQADFVDEHPEFIAKVHIFAFRMGALLAVSTGIFWAVIGGGKNNDR